MSAVPARLLLGVLGGYALASAAAVFAAAILPLPRPQAVLAATLGSFALFVAVIVTAFAVSAIGRFALLLAGAIVLLGGAGLALAGL